MSTTYSQINRQVSIRINAITGATASTLETNYTTTPFTSTQGNASTIFTFSAIKDAILNIEGRLADAIASTGDHPFRSYIGSTTSALTNGAALPSLDASSKEIIGVWGSVFDSSDTTKVYRAKDIAQVIRRTTNPNSKYKVTVYWYFMDDQNIYHTGTSVKCKCCIYTRSDQSTSFDANGNIVIPDVLADALVCGAVSELVRDDEFMGQAQVYRKYFEAADQAIRQGLTSTPAKAEVGPLLQQPSY